MLRFILGESKYVKFIVRSRKQEAFSIRSASWELYYDGVLEDTGDCEIEQSDTGIYLKMMLEPEKRSSKYQLFVTYYVGEETKKHMEYMEVF